MATHQLALTPISDFFLSSEVVTMRQTDSAAHKLKLRLFHKSTHFRVHSADFYSGVNRAWQYYQTPKSAVASEQFHLLNPVAVLPAIQPYNLHFKVQMASSYCNSSTPVPLLGTLFNTILHFSKQMAYLPNMSRCSRWIHKRNHSSPRSPFSTIQPGWTVSPVPGPSIIPADNDPNWEDAHTNPITNTTTANRPTSSTHLWSKPHWSENTNEQLSDILGQLANILNSNQTPSPNTNTRGTKACISGTFSSTKPDKLNNFLF